MQKKFSKVYSGDTFPALIRAYHEDRLLSDPVYRADYLAAQEEKRNAVTPSQCG